jgi:ABC-2 type transport system permease protein
MTTTLDNTQPRTIPSGRSGFPQLVRSEWTKLRSVRSTWICLFLIFFLTVLFAWIFPAAVASHWTTGKASDRLNFDPVSTTQIGVIFSQLVVGVFGALAITSEYSTGSIRTTLAAIPRRSTLIAAKSFVVFVLVFIVSEITAFIAFFVGSAVLKSYGGQELPANSTLLDQLRSPHAPVASISQHGVAIAIFRGGLYLALIALIALAIGLLLRHSAGAISVIVGLVFVVPLLIQALPNSISKPIQPKLPSNLGAAMSSTRARVTDFGGSLLHPWPAALLLAVYAAVLLGLGIWAFVRRDA